MTTWRDLLADAERSLARARVEAPTVEARRIIEDVAGAPDGSLVLMIDQSTPEIAARRIGDMVQRRAAGEPLQYVLGSWAFLGLDLYVDHRVLIPRPETEQTARVALDEAARLGLRRGRSDPWRGAPGTELVADLGTGSGALALALASELPDAMVWATDRSPEALAVARANLAGTGSPATRVRLAEGDWFAALPTELAGRFQLVVTNPPYVATHELDTLPAEVAEHEPLDALVAGPTGFEAIEVVITGAHEYLVPDTGTIVVEVAPHQATAAVELARQSGFNDARIEPDLAGRDRVLVARGG